MTLTPSRRIRDHRWCVLTIFGSKLPSRSLGTSISTGPTSFNGFPGCLDLLELPAATR